VEVESEKQEGRSLESQAGGRLGALFLSGGTVLTGGGMANGELVGPVPAGENSQTARGLLPVERTLGFVGAFGPERAIGLVSAVGLL
jgi:hypothetical protein